MSVIEAIVLGLVQGLTEFLPISSTAHLRILPALFGWEDPGAGFSAVIQLGTMAAVLLYFRRELWRIAASWAQELWLPFGRKSPDARLGWYIIFATIPISVVGLVFKDQIESSARSLVLIGSVMIVFSLVMLAADRFGSERRDLTATNLADAVVVGIAQALALIPGVSRSGATISAGLVRGFDRASAARYSFLLSVPAVVLSGLLNCARSGAVLRPRSKRRSSPASWRLSPATRQLPGCCGTWHGTR